MSPLEITVVLTRWVHVIATVSWVGGNFFFLFVLRPALRGTTGVPADLGRRIGARFKELVDLSMWVLIVTGGLLVFDRLTASVPMPYLIALALKLGLSAAMFLLAISLGRRPRRQTSLLEGTWTDLFPRRMAAGLANASARWSRTISPTNVLAVLGPVIVFLGLLLRALA